MADVIWKMEPHFDKRVNALQALGFRVNLHSYAWSPPTDVYETDVSIVVRVEVAGMRDDDFSIQVENNTLIISGVRIDAQERRAYQQMEIRFGEFSTGVELPPGVDTNKADAQYKDGFLTVILPKLKPAEVRIQG